MERLILATAALLIAVIIAVPLIATGSDDSTEIPSVEMLPDVEGIYHNCVNNPLQEAGKTIEDPEIKQYYDDLLSDCGFDTEEPL